MYNVVKNLLLALLCIVGTLLPGEIIVGNAGYPGDATTQVLARLNKDVLSYRPNVVTIMLGTNDAGNPQRHLSVAEYEKNLNAIVQLLKKIGTRQIVISGPPPICESILRGRSPQLANIIPATVKVNDRVQEYCAAAKRVAAANKAAYFDFFSLIESHGGATEAASSLIRNPKNCGAADGVHPTPEGHQIIGKAMAELLRPLVKDGDVVICLGDSITYGANVTGAGTVTGAPWPAELWRQLNPELAKAQKIPSQPHSPFQAVPPNRIVNHSMEFTGNDGAPIAWAFWKKNSDKFSSESGEAADGKRFIRLAGSAASDAMCRTDFFHTKPGNYDLTVMVRGQGELRISVGIYDPTKITEVKKIRLTNRWQKVTAQFTFPAGSWNRSCVIFNTKGTADIDNLYFAPTGSQAATDKTLKPVKSVYTLDGGQLKMQFGPERLGAPVVRITDAQGVNFVNFPHDTGLWSLRLRPLKPQIKFDTPYAPITFDPERDESQAVGEMDGYAGEDIVIRAETALKNGGQASVEQCDGKLVFRWKNLGCGTERNVLDVTVIAAPGSNGGVRFERSFVNRSKKYTVFNFNSPRFKGLGNIKNNAAGDVLAVPHYMGRLIQRPASGKLLDSSIFYRGNNSGHSMHFDALYNSGNGLYFHVADPDQNVKRWLMNSSATQGFGWESVYLPDNMKVQPTQSRQVPYPVEIQPFAGDWFDAANRYRKWALQQVWSSAGTLEERRSKDMPEWFLNRTFWVQEAVCNLLTSRFETFKKFMEEFGQYNPGLWLTHWGLDNKEYDFPNPDRFPLTELDLKTRDYLRKNYPDMPVSGYIQVTGWNRSGNIFKNTPNAKEQLVYDFFGQNRVWGSGGLYHDASFAYPGEVWRNIIGNVVREMAEAGFKVAYLDSGNHGGVHLNFNPKLHPGVCGGGSAYVDRNRELLLNARSEARKIESDFCTTAESFWEGNLHCLNAVLTVNSPAVFMEADRVVPIPLAQAVYHDYALCFATHYSRKDLQDNARGLIAKTGQAFVHGIMPGWELINVFYLYDSPETVRAAAHHRFKAYEAARKYLEFGKMLRPPVVGGNSPYPVSSWAKEWGPATYSIILDQVQSSAWEAADGSFGLVLYNLDEAPVKVKIPVKDYPGNHAEMCAVYPAEQTFSMNGEIVEIELPGRVPVILEASE